MKLIPSALLELVVLLTPGAATAQYSWYGDFQYIDNNGSTDTVAITGYKGSGGEVNIPSSVNGLRVTSIGNGAFWGSTGLVSVVIPSSVSFIDFGAFTDCFALTNVFFLGNAPPRRRPERFGLRW